MLDQTTILLQETYQIILEDRSDLYSWMDPNGKIHKFPDHQTHGEFARNLMKASATQFHDNLNTMFFKGWFRLTYYGDLIYAHNSKRMPNIKQLY
jgi:hypothetical protein